MMQTFLDQLQAKLLLASFVNNLSIYAYTKAKQYHKQDTQQIRYRNHQIQFYIRHQQQNIPIKKNKNGILN